MCLCGRVYDNEKVRVSFLGEMIYNDVAMTAIEGEDCLPTLVVVSSLHKRKIDFDKRVPES